MRCSRYDLQAFLAAQFGKCRLVHRDDLLVTPADDKQRRRLNPLKGWAGKIRPPTAGHDGSYCLTSLGRCYKGGPAAGAGAEVANSKHPGARIARQPIARVSESIGQEINIE